MEKPILHVRQLKGARHLLVPQLIKKPEVFGFGFFDFFALNPGIYPGLKNVLTKLIG